MDASRRSIAPRVPSQLGLPKNIGPAQQTAQPKVTMVGNLAQGDLTLLLCAREKIQDRFQRPPGFLDPQAGFGKALQITIERVRVLSNRPPRRRTRASSRTIASRSDA